MGQTISNWFGCCCGGKMEKEPKMTFQPSSNRNCTDILFLIMYIISWAGLISIIATAGGLGGNPKRITNGVDHQGNICGHGAGFRTPYAAWVTTNAAAITISGKDCTNCYKIRTCVADCSVTSIPAGNPGANTDILDKYNSERLLNLCVPSPLTVNGTQQVFAFSSEFDSATEAASRAFADLYIAWPIILISVGVALLFSYGYTWLSERWAGLNHTNTIYFYILIDVLLGLNRILSIYYLY